MARPRTAFQYYSRSLETAERGGDVAGQARVWLDLGRLLTSAAPPAWPSEPNSNNPNNRSCNNSQSNAAVSPASDGHQSSAGAACYRAALRLTSGDVTGHLPKTTTTATTSTTTTAIL